MNLVSKFKIFFFKLYWFLFARITTVTDVFLFVLNVPISKASQLKYTHKKIIVYLGQQLPPRIPRMAKWVKRSGEYSTMLVCSQRGYFEKFSNNEFDAVFLFRNEFHLKRILKQLPKISLIHAFAPKSYYPNLARQIVKHPFVLDMQDVYSIYYGLNPTLGWLKKELPHEKECLKKADGIIAHSLEPNVALRKYGIKKKPKTIFFPLYCDEDVFQNNEKKLNLDAIHIVYAGGVVGSHRNSAEYGSLQHHWLIKILSEQKIHFHLYPTPAGIHADYEEYKTIAKYNSYFHFHEPVAQQKLAAELSQYHFGILAFFTEQNKQSPDKYKFATTLKLFNYMEAGIPVLISKDIIYQRWMAERYKAGIVLSAKEDINSLREIILKIDYQKQVKDLMLKRNKISLSRNIPRLIKFYDQIIA